jgi:hypothetical protein
MPQRKVISVMMEEKPQILIDYNHHMGYVDKGDRKANSYSISRCTLKWMKEIVFSTVRPGHS